MQGVARKNCVVALLLLAVFVLALAPPALAEAERWVVYQGVPLDPDDLRQEACLGLCLAAASWDPGKAPFSVYARIRVRGAVLDALRGARFGKRNKEARWFVTLDEPDPESGESPKDMIPADDLSPEETVIRLAEQAQLREALAALSERERFILESWAEGELLKHVGARLGFSESRACQLAKRGLRRLKAMMERGA